MTHTYAAYKRPTAEQKDLHRMKVKGWKKNVPSKWTGKKKKAGVAILISYRNRLQNKAIKRDKEEHLKYSREESIKKT